MTTLLTTNEKDEKNNTINYKGRVKKNGGYNIILIYMSNIQTRKRKRETTVCQKLDIDPNDKITQHDMSSSFVNLTEHALPIDPVTTDKYNTDKDDKYNTNKDTVIITITTHGAILCFENQKFEHRNDRRGVFIEERLDEFTSDPNKERYNFTRGDNDPNFPDEDDKVDPDFVPEEDDEEDYENEDEELWHTRLRKRNLPKIDKPPKLTPHNRKYTKNEELWHTRLRERKRQKNGKPSLIPHYRRLRPYDDFEYFPLTTKVPTNMTIHKINISAPGIVAYGFAEYLNSIKGNNPQNTYIDELLKADDNLIKKIYEEKIMPNFKKIYEETKSSFNHNDNHKAFERTNHLGYTHHCIKGGKRIVNKAYSKDVNDKKLFDGDFQISVLKYGGHVMTPINIFRKYNKGSGGIIESTTTEEIISYFENVKRLIIFDFSCSVFVDYKTGKQIPYSNNERKIRRTICRDDVAYGGNKNKNKSKKNKNKSKNKKKSKKNKPN